ncbi:hypothetical protein GCM10011515_02950 [Tsuneonella deserti]|uniref:Uncharacterized protein n=1 Tax=Tsuneonella deserti TaxID=2035528 RepID=A0ABQ1RY58_9SPHN|nr:hypothetical protein [Tsuneonella deserti]GGD86879.1 hypothetical protein GCM10011515_02950 [Tsuneonella deserti]
MLSRSDVEAQFIGTRTEGAVFRFRACVSGAATPEVVREASRGALDVVEIFCSSVLDGIDKPLIDWDGVGSFADWPCDEEAMIYKYSGLGSDWNNMTVIISDRYLATCFREVFCRA